MRQKIYLHSGFICMLSRTYLVWFETWFSSFALFNCSRQFLQNDTSSVIHFLIYDLYNLLILLLNYRIEMIFMISDIFRYLYSNLFMLVIIQTQNMTNSFAINLKSPYLNSIAFWLMPINPWAEGMIMSSSITNLSISLTSILYSYKYL